MGGRGLVMVMMVLTVLEMLKFLSGHELKQHSADPCMVRASIEQRSRFVCT